MNKTIITHADRDGLASAAVWLYHHPDIDQVYAIRDPKQAAAVIRALEPDQQNICLFDLPYSKPTAEALDERFRLGADVHWIDHHLPSWQGERYPMPAHKPLRWRILLPERHRTTALHMTLDWIYQDTPAQDSPYITLPNRTKDSIYPIPRPLVQYRSEVCGQGEQTDRVFLLDAIEDLANHSETPDHSELKTMLLHSLQGNASLTEHEHDLAGHFRQRYEAVADFFNRPSEDKSIWDHSDGVVYVRNPNHGVLKGISRKTISILSQKQTGAAISVIRQESDWLYAGVSYRQGLNLSQVVREVPGIAGAERMIGHDYVVSLRGFSIEGQSEPIDIVVNHLRSLQK